MKDLFKEIIPSLLQNNEYQLESQDDVNSYNPYVVNKALCSHIDTVYFAQQMNLNHQLSKNMQYDYLFYSIRKYKRPYQKWVKYTEQKDLQYIKDYYGYSTPKAKQVLSLLTIEQLDKIKAKLDKGGNSK